jgi:hypothetical protein
MRCSDCGKTLSPVVALDIDGTLADYHGWFLLFAEAWIGRVLPTEFTGDRPFSEALRLARRDYEEIKLAYRQGGLKRSMPAREGAASLVTELNAAGAEVWITTTRPYLRLDNIDPDTRHWLDRNNIYPYAGLIYDEDKYRTLVDRVGKERIVGVLEDLPEQWDMAQTLGIQPIQFGTRYNSAKVAIREPRVVGCQEAQEMLLGKVGEWYKANGK